MTDSVRSEFKAIAEDLKALKRDSAEVMRQVAQSNKDFTDFVVKMNEVANLEGDDATRMRESENLARAMDELKKRQADEARQINEISARWDAITARQRRFDDEMKRLSAN
jgi:predicted  nucleic acid-binding Zn-ribbon protein